jgi:hypothetical protein
MDHNPSLIRVWREEMLLRAVIYVCLAEDLRTGDLLSLVKTPPHRNLDIVTPAGRAFEPTSL